jgi:hypothetical protein
MVIKRGAKDMAENWKVLKMYNGKYQVSDMGNVYSYFKSKMLKQKTDKDGYKSVCLTLPNGKTKHERVHRLVALEFCEKPNGHNVVNHKNMIKDDNTVKNLEWSTVSKNTKHAYDNNEKIRKSTYAASLLGAEKTRITIDVYKHGVFVGRFEGKESCAEELGINAKTIYNSINKRFVNREGYEFIKVGDACADKIE